MEIFFGSCGHDDVVVVASIIDFPATLAISGFFVGASASAARHHL
jgi:hypothetical protein